MPLYEYRCNTCHAVTTALRSADDGGAPVACETCGGEAVRILSRPSVHRSRLSRVERLDPRYDKLVDRTMAKTRDADPDRLLRRMKPFSDD